MCTHPQVTKWKGGIVILNMALRKDFFEMTLRGNSSSQANISGAKMFPAERTGSESRESGFRQSKTSVAITERVGWASPGCEAVERQVATLLGLRST